MGGAEAGAGAERREHHQVLSRQIEDLPGHCLGHLTGLAGGVGGEGSSRFTDGVYLQLILRFVSRKHVKSEQLEPFLYRNGPIER